MAGPGEKGSTRLEVAEVKVRLRPGDAIITFRIQAGQAGGMLYVDNLEIARVRPAPTKPSGKGN